MRPTHSKPEKTNSSESVNSDSQHHVQLLTDLMLLAGQSNVLTSTKAVHPYTQGMVVNDEQASVLAVVLPKSLVVLWRVINACAKADVIVIAQAANTSLTGGSTPHGDYDRPVVMLSMRHLKGIHLLNEGKEVVALPAATLQQLEHQLAPLGREPHSVLGSSCVGASVIGGVCNNSGGTLVQRGPAYTQMALFARLNELGEFELINHLGITLNDDGNNAQDTENGVEKMLQRLEQGDFADSDVQVVDHSAICNHEYQTRVRDCQSGTPARHNNDPEGLFEASGSAGRVIVFAVRLATFSQPKVVQTYYYSVNNPDALTNLRRDWLTSDLPLPILAEYMHKDYNQVTFEYGVDTCFVLNHLNATTISKMYNWQSRLAFWLKRFRLPQTLPDRLMQLASRWLSKPLSADLTQQAGTYQYHLIIKVADDAIAPATTFLSAHLKQYGGALYHCSEKESKELLNFRFAATAAMLRFHKLHYRTRFGDLISTDIALPRNSCDWDEKLPPEIEAYVEKTLYLGHFFCYVMHQDYLLKPESNEQEVKDKLLEFYDECNIMYPAEHNVGHIYTAHHELKEFYRKLDPTNSLNPGIGRTGKNKNWQ